MNRKINALTAASALLVASLSTEVLGQARALDSISTPDQVQTRLGTLEFRDGAPSAAGTSPGNWIQTLPGKGFFVILRLYSPLEPFFNKTWRPGEIQPVK